MRIRELEIQNFRNIKYIKIVPRKVNQCDLVVLIGENNVGKTNILTLLHLLFNPERSVRTLNFTDADFHDVLEPMIATIVFEDLSEELLATFYNVLDYIPGSEELGILSLSFRCTYDSDTKDAEPQLTFSRDLERSVSFAEKKMLSFYLQDALRDYRTIHSGRTSLFERILQQIDISSQEQHMIDKLNEASNLLHSNEQIQQFATSVHQIANNIIDLPTDEGTVRLTVASSSAVDLKKHIRMQLRQPGLQNYLDVNELGLGLQSVLTMSIFRAFAGIGQLRDGVFAVDEPEAHLYPNSQRAMYRQIMDLSTVRQVWVSTHSPSLLEHVDPRQIVRVYKLTDGTSDVVQLPDDFPVEYLSSYEKYLDVDKADAFFSRAVLLVEGPTEQGLFPSAGAILSNEFPQFDFDRVGVTTIHAGGKTNIKTLARLLRNFGIPSCVLVDWDNSDKDHDRIVGEIKEITPHVLEYARIPDMGDIEGALCLGAPLRDMVKFQDEVLPERIAVGTVMEELRKVAQSFESTYSDQISTIRREHGTLADIIPILDQLIDESPESDALIREKLAAGLRKSKNRTTGRLLAERFIGFLPPTIIECFETVTHLAGYGGGNDENGNPES